ncbi:MAG: AMP-binding protein [Flavobacteriales bacterium]|nr:AMP-binding protein [Flavobacteriales bacterium]
MGSLVDILSQFGLEATEASALSANIEAAMEGNGQVNAWSEISRNLLKPGMSGELHRHVFDHVFKGWEGEEPKPVWIPSKEEIGRTNTHAFYSDLGLDDFISLHEWSNSNSLDFWQKITTDLEIQFSKPWERISPSDDPEHPDWFKGAKMNIADSCFNRSSEDLAITFQMEGGKIQYWTFGELRSLSNRIANGLENQGLKQGDAVAVDMVMTAESVAIYLGAVMAGCAIVSIPDSIAADEIQKRLEISDAKLVFTQDVLLRAGKELPLYEKILKTNAAAVVVLPADGDLRVTLEERHLEWSTFLSEDKHFESIQCDPLDHINILFSSGTTGDPKAIPWNHTTPIKCASDGYFHHDIKAGNVVAWPTNLGWMMGPWLIFASFLNKASMALYYGAPMGTEFGEFVRDAKVNMLGVVPSMVKNWRNSNALNGIDWTRINNFSSTGESSNADDMFWLMGQAGYKPVIEYCGGTEIGGGYLSGSMLQPAAPSYFTTPCMGLNLHVLDEMGKETNQGEIYISGMSIGLSIELLNQDHHQVYFEDTPQRESQNLRRHGDAIGGVHDA